MPKVHKDKIPVPLRLVVATINTPIHAIDKLVAHWLSPITKQVDTFSRDLDHLIKKLYDLGEIKPNEYLSTDNVIVMHPNIDAEEGMSVPLLSFELNIVNCNTDSNPIKQLIRYIFLLMKCNVFNFGDT